MPRVTMQTVTQTTPETVVIAVGTTIEEFINNYGDVSPNKVSILINGVATTDLGHILNNGDSVVLKPLNYSSGIREFIVATA